MLDAELRATGVSLASYLGADKAAAVCGVSIGITDTTEELRAQVDEHLEQGYRRIKLKIMPGLDVERVAAIRADHPDILLSVDANAAYVPGDLAVFRALDDYGLLMVEQPLHYEDLVRHAALQAEITTRDLPGRIDPLGRRRGRGDRAGRVPDREHQAGPRGRRARRHAACTTWRPRPAFPCGAAGCSRPGSAARPTSALAGMPDFRAARRHERVGEVLP